MDKNKGMAVCIVMLTLGTSWAIRGSFGHEYGAAWAGSIGVLAMVLVSGRSDWRKNWPVIAAMAAVGWGVTGMISYGQVVGYGKSTDFMNASYGLLCLFLIGGLFGFLGGGLTGLMLESPKDKKTDWAGLMAQMVAGAYIVWGYLIFQLEWFMTPPRSELWAACLGAAIALAWFLKRNSYKNTWYVAFSTMLGAGFGFAFGNFIQTMGSSFGISFNWWNAMEYSIGFFGGLGMAWGIFSRKWDEMIVYSKPTKIISAIFLFLFVPFVTIVNSFSSKDIQELAQMLEVSDPIHFYSSQWILITGLSIAALLVIDFQLKKLLSEKTSVRQLFIVFFTSWLWYKSLQVLMSGILYEYHFSSYDLAFLNMIVVALLWKVRKPITPFRNHLSDEKFNRKLIKTGLSAICFILILAMVAIHSHEEIHGQKQRFEVTTSQLK